MKQKQTLYAYQLASHCITVLSIRGKQTQNKKPILKMTQMYKCAHLLPFLALNFQGLRHELGYVAHVDGGNAGQEGRKQSCITLTGTGPATHVSCLIEETDAACRPVACEASDNALERIRQVESELPCRRNALAT